MTSHFHNDQSDGLKLVTVLEYVITEYLSVADPKLSWGGTNSQSGCANLFFCNFYQPQGSWAKVIFSEACVKKSVHGGGAGSGPGGVLQILGVSNFLGGRFSNFWGGSPTFQGGLNLFERSPIFGGSPIFRGVSKFSNFPDMVSERPVRIRLGAYPCPHFLDQPLLITCLKLKRGIMPSRKSTHF